MRAHCTAKLCINIICSFVRSAFVCVFLYFKQKFRFLCGEHVVSFSIYFGLYLFMVRLNCFVLTTRRPLHVHRRKRWTQPKTCSPRIIINDWNWIAGWKQNYQFRYWPNNFFVSLLSFSIKKRAPREIHKFRWLFWPFYIFPHKWNMCWCEHEHSKFVMLFPFIIENECKKNRCFANVSSGFSFDLRALNVECASSIVCQFLENEQFPFVLLPWNRLLLSVISVPIFFYPSISFCRSFCWSRKINQTHNSSAYRYASRVPNKWALS